MVKANIKGESVILLPESEFNRLLSSSKEKYINRKEVAELWGISPNRLSECPWLLPKKSKWKHEKYLASEILELVKIGKEELKKQWS